MSGKGDIQRPTQVDAKTFSDNWERIFNAARLGANAASKPANVDSISTAAAISGTAPHESAASAGQVDSRGQIYLNADTGE